MTASPFSPGPVLVLGLVVGLVLGAAVGVLLGLRAGAARAAPLRARLAETELAQARLRAGEREVEQLVAPLRDQLLRLEAQLQSLDRERARAGAELRAHVGAVAAGSERLGRETAALVTALRRPHVRGRWGEVQLRRVCELAGMLDRCDFLEQPTLPGEDGALRPDLVVQLPGGRCVVVDAKVSLEAHLTGAEAAVAGDEARRADRAAAHGRQVRAHVDRLADKAYWRQFPAAPEFVVLFLPGESLLSAALDVDPALLEHAFTRRVHLATPTTLLSLLRAVAHGWQQQALTDNATAVLAAGRELFDRLATLGRHVDKLGRSLSRAVGDYNAAVGSLERSVLPSARRMSALGLSGELPALTPVEDLPRRVTAPHLVVLDDPPDELPPLTRQAP